MAGNTVTRKTRRGRGKPGRGDHDSTPSMPLMQRNSRVARWGNSLAFRIPQDVADRLKLRSGGQVSLEVRPDSITVRPVRKTWSEAELLEGVKPEMVGGELDWGAAVGKEAW